MVKPAKLLIGCFFTVICLLFSAQLLAADASTLVNIAGQQRMLSQKIVKAYLFQGERVRTRKARKQLKEGVALFRKNHQTLLIEIADPTIKQLLEFVGTTIDELDTLIQQKYGHENSARLLALSDSLLEVSQSIVEKIELSFNLQQTAIVSEAGRQRMLSQRIAKYYIAYQAGFQGEEVVAQLNKAVNEFDIAHKRLMGSSRNTPEITRELERVEGLWVVVRAFFLNIEKGGLPVTVFSTCDSILKHMHKITTMYAEL
ncbi:MAG: type IV pili methyl-accepting chemotaxis transducer N-terminal domain-containing protein [Candidatus Polarisedimenticolaceae bacterium]|nr:type IV pili methyl-accepting chemotaxis transducer N-terminal domain-containing protein [Candidatus Polarisedimenticolaceae bacterium]